MFIQLSLIQDPKKLQGLDVVSFCFCFFFSFWLLWNGPFYDGLVFCTSSSFVAGFSHVNIFIKDVDLNWEQPIFGLEHGIETNKLADIPKGKKLMTSRTLKTSRTFRILSAIISAVEAPGKIRTLLGSNLNRNIYLLNNLKVFSM